MKATFITSGSVREVLYDDGTIKGYKVGRAKGGSIYLLYVIDEYYKKGKHIYIDSHGTPWVKK